MPLFKLTAFLVLTLASPWVAAQTNCPGYITQLEHGLSESPLAAVVPADVAVQAPGHNISLSKARWSGIWSGWGCPARACDIKLVVEKLSDASATVVYVGASDSSELSERVQAVFSGDELQATLSTGTAISFRFRAGNNGVMEFVGYNKGELRVAGVLSQIAAVTKTAAAAQTPPLAKATERIPTLFTDNGSPSRWRWSSTNRLAVARFRL